MLKTVFWILALTIVYSYFGYAILLFIIRTLKATFIKTKSPATFTFPPVTLLIAAYNEKEIVEKKMQNTKALDYPSDKLTVMWITDGSDDGTPELLKDKYPFVKVLHIPDRLGKTAALNRAMKYIETPYVVFSDANTIIESSALKYLLKPFADKKIGCVAGEKRIVQNVYDNAAGVGEGTYWQYESWLKKLESDVYTTMAAAGELYAIRTDIFTEAEPDSIIDDFVISLKIAQKGYRIRYEPEAYAMESASADVNEELKRKIRISSGGVQTFIRFPSLLNIFKYGFLSFEYFSHKVLRWLVIPLAIPVLFILNILICYIQSWQPGIFLMLMVLQILFYILVGIGFLLEKSNLKWKFLFLPFYLIIMNYSQIAGLVRYITGKHTVVWEKAKRA